MFNRFSKAFLPLRIGFVVTATFLMSSAAKAEFFTLADGESLFYQRAGSGPATIMLAAHAYSYPLVQALADKGWSVVAYDPRGRGRSSYVENADSLGIMQDVADLEALRQHLKVAKIHLAGFSFAGRIVMAYAAQYPERVERLGLLAPAPLRFDMKFRDPAHARRAPPEDFAKALERVRALRQQDMHAKSPQEYCRSERALWLHSWASTEETRNDIVAFMDRLCSTDYANEWPIHFSRYVEHSSASRAGLFSDTLLDAIRVPTLLVHGELDRNAPLGGSYYWAWRLRQARLMVIANRAHALHFEDTGTVAAALDIFFRGSWPDSAMEVQTSPLADAAAN